MNHVDEQYKKTLTNALSGHVKENRTGVSAISTFGQTMRFDLSNGKLPLLTTKKVFLRAIIHELLWLLTGDTNIRYLKEHGVSIWDAWIDPSSAEYVGLTDDEIEEAIKREENVTSIVFDDMVESGETYMRFKNTLIFLIDPNQADRWGQAYRAVFEQEPKRLVAGDLPKVYGKQWRYWDDTRIVSAEEATEKEASGFTVVGEVTPGRYAIQRKIDQIGNVIEHLKHNPDSRRIIVSAWNVGEIDEMALPPCHSFFQFWTRELSVPERGKWLITHRPELGDAYTEHIMEVMPFDWDSGNTTEAEVVKCVEEEAVIQTRLSEWLDDHAIPKRALSCQLYQR